MLVVNCATMKHSRIENAALFAACVVLLAGHAIAQPAPVDELAIEGSNMEDDGTVQAQGDVIVATEPAQVVIALDGDEGFAPHPNRADTLLQRRSPATLRAVDPTREHLVWLASPNYRARAVILPALGTDGSLWVDEGGRYVVRLNEALELLDGREAELRTRMRLLTCVDDCPDPPPTTADAVTIQVRSEPPGARVRYAGHLITDKAGNPLRTPLQFSTVPGAEPGSNEPVTLTLSGAPLEVEIPGGLATVTGIYPRDFLCNPLFDGEMPTAESHCRYTFDSCVIKLYSAEEWALEYADQLQP